MICSALRGCTTVSRLPCITSAGTKPNLRDTLRIASSAVVSGDSRAPARIACAAPSAESAARYIKPATMATAATIAPHHLPLLGPRLEPVPAAQRIGAQRLLWIQHDKAVLVRHLVHSRTLRESERILTATVQHQQERHAVAPSHRGAEIP